MNPEKKSPSRKAQIANIKNLKGKAEAYRVYAPESNFTDALNKLNKYHKKVQKTLIKIEEKYEKLGGKDIHTYITDENGEVILDTDGKPLDYEKAEAQFKGFKAFVNKIKQSKITERNRLKVEYRILAEIWHKVDNFLNQDYQEKKFTEQATYTEDLKLLLQRTDVDPADIQLKEEAKELLEELKEYYEAREDVSKAVVFGTNNVIPTVLEHHNRRETGDKVIPSGGEPDNSYTSKANVSTATVTEERKLSFSEVKSPNAERAKEKEINPIELIAIKNNIKELATNIAPDKVVGRIVGFTENTVIYQDTYGKTHEVEYNHDIPKKRELNTKKFIESDEYIGVCESYQGVQNKVEYSKFLTKIIHERVREEKPEVFTRLKSIDDINQITSITEPNNKGEFKIIFVNNIGEEKFIKITFKNGVPANEIKKMKELVAINEVLPLSEIKLGNEEYLNQKAELGIKLENAQKIYKNLNSKRVEAKKQSLENNFAKVINKLSSDIKNRIKPIMDLIGAVSNENPLSYDWEELFVLDLDQLNFTTEQEKITYVDNLVKDSSDLLAILNRQLLLIKEIKKVIRDDIPTINNLEDIVTQEYQRLEKKNIQLQEELTYSREAYSTYTLGYPQSFRDLLKWIPRLAIYDEEKGVKAYPFIKERHKITNEKVVEKLETDNIEPFVRKYNYNYNPVDNLKILVDKKKLTQEEVDEYKSILKIPPINRTFDQSKRYKTLKSIIPQLVAQLNLQKNNPATKEEWLTKAEQQIKNIDTGNKAERKVYETISKQPEIFGVQASPQWSVADMRGIDALVFTCKRQPEEEDSKIIVELLSKSVMLPYKNSYKKFENIVAPLTNADRIIDNTEPSEDEKMSKYIDKPTEQLKFYQQGRITNNEILKNLDESINNSSESLMRLSPTEETKLNLLLAKYGIEVFPVQVKNIIGKTIRGKAVEKPKIPKKPIKEKSEKNNKLEELKINSVMFSLYPIDSRDSADLKPTAQRPDDLPKDPRITEAEPTIPYTNRLEETIQMVLGRGNPPDFYNEPRANTGYRINAMDLPGETDALPGPYHIEPERDLMANVRNILTK